MSSIRPQTVTLAAVAVVFGLVAAYGAKRILEPKPVVAVVENPKTVTVVVAQTNLTPYARIGDRDAQTVEVPAEGAPSGAMRVKARAVGRLVKTTILAGFPIREADLYEPGTVPKMADQLRPGYRAVTLKVDDAIASNGAILSGSFVDISLTFDSDHPEVDGTATVNLMRKLKVLASGPASKDAALFSAGRDKVGITVEATPEQANRLILAQQYGTINVTLCSSSDKDAGVLAEGNRNLINKFDLLGLPPLPPPPLQPIVEPVVRKVVEVYRASEMRQVVFNEAGELLSTEAAVSPDVDQVAPGQNAAAPKVNVAGTKPKKCLTCGKKKTVRFGAALQLPAAGDGDVPAAPTASRDAGGAGQPTPAAKPAGPQPTPATPATN
ncbi:MAG: Flp pilus assembly protein CpaB [Thermoguttaceae bacterium]|jgi:pilus assembly protein CpaB